VTTCCGGYPNYIIAVMEQKYYVYKITNLINKKIYIGMTKNIETRWLTHKTRSKTRKTLLYCAMNHYGLENFKIDVLETCATELEAKNAEIRLIASLGTQNSSTGYNMTAGGDGVCNPSDEIRSKMSISRTGKKASLETKQKMSNKRKGCIFSNTHRENLSKAGKLRYEYGHKVEFKESTRQKLSEKSKGSRNPSAKLTEKEVLEIKRLLKSKLYTHYQIADMFKISRSTVGFIKNERLWAHVKLDDED
jgi:group I intron endonuclease